MVPANENGIITSGDPNYKPLNLAENNGGDGKVKTKSSIAFMTRIPGMTFVFESDKSVDELDTMVSNAQSGDVLSFYSSKPSKINDDIVTDVAEKLVYNKEFIVYVIIGRVPAISLDTNVEKMKKLIIHS
jgi:hypothetical protein